MCCSVTYKNNPVVTIGLIEVVRKIFYLIYRKKIIYLQKTKNNEELK